MIPLKKTLALTLIAIIAFGINSCGNAKTGSDSITFQENPPFVIELATSQKWIAGVKEGGSGTNMEVNISQVKQGVVFKDLYYRGQVAHIKTSPRVRGSYKASFLDDKKDFIMDSDPVVEAQNTPRTVFPFELNLFEAVLSYEYQDTVSYVKIPEVLEKELLALPSQNPNGID